MKPFRLSKFMTIPPSDERKLLKTVEADDAPFDSEASRKSRVKHQKVKTGCYTCKVRRVKCDETKPSCKRCKKTGIQCEGYPSRVIQRPSREYTNRMSIVESPPRSQSPIVNIHIGPILENEQDSRYFQYFRETSASDIARLFNRTVWERLIPQASESEPFVSQALVALGAFSKGRTSSGIEAFLHRQYGLDQYGKALVGMRQALNPSSYNARKALIACLLVYSIESIQGHLATAASHAASGENLLHEIMLDKKSKSLPPFSCQQDSSIDDDLCRAFSDLDLQALCVIDRRSSKLHERRTRDLNHLLLSMPSSFSSIKECHDWWQIIMRRNFHWIATARKTILEERPKNDEEPVVYAADDEGLDLKDENCSWTSVAVIPSTNPTLRRDCTTYLDDILRWESIAAPLVNKGLRSAEDSREFLAACLAKIQAAMMMIQVSTKLRPRIVQGEGKYHFDFGVILPMFMVGTHCRNRELRDQAIDTLREAKGYREGIWDSDACSRVTGFTRDVEEEWADENGWVPGERRFTITGTKVTVDKGKSLHISGYQKNGTLEGKGDFKEIHITW
ncbi:similar to transcription factor Cys6 [Botrytis cinerea T4]|uniref:Similar to transcription factor Cys6 n=1 Tax=Botryotinia fuckeliana (strain T4) TaxID=999810 RepID=G2YMP0_BOTF4|nr:similar to transcription factor Cys6 [Botrytis cinerea T4]